MMREESLWKKAAIISAIILMIFVISGVLIFDIFSITIEAFQIAGGILVAKVGFSMLNSKADQIKNKEEETELIKKQDISIIPLAIPMLSGPGAIATVLVWSNGAPGITEKFGILIIIMIISFISYFVLLKAKLLKKFLGQSGTQVIEKVMGLIVLVMGIQFIINALKTIIPTII